MSINAITAPPEAERPNLILDNQHLQALHKELVERSSGCSVEQLEQVRSVLMDAIWQKRGQWNRNSLVKAVETAFNECIKDIEYMQIIGKPSQDSQERLEGRFDDSE